MQPNELKALLSSTNEVAVYAAHVEVEINNQRNKRREIVCPSGLVRAKVISDGVSWTERRTISACGDQEFEIKRKNGVLIELDPDDLPKKMFAIVGGNVYVYSNGRRSKRPYPHTEVVTISEKEGESRRVIHMITSRKAIFSSWGEYALEQAKRAKTQEEAIQRDDALILPQAALTGMSREEFEKLHVNKTDERHVYLGRDWIVTETMKDAEGNTVYEHDRYGWSRPVPKTELGRIEITIDQAEKILAMLTPAQKKKLANS